MVSSAQGPATLNGRGTQRRVVERVTDSVCGRHWCWFPWTEDAGSPGSRPDGLGMVIAQGQTFPRKDSWEAPASRAQGGEAEPPKESGKK